METISIGPVTLPAESRPSKTLVLDEIKRTAAENGGVPLGRARFETETGIRETDWSGRYWARWSDALREAGFEPNRMNQPNRVSDLARKLALLTRELGHLPSIAEMKMKGRSDLSFPSPGGFNRLGKTRKGRANGVLEFAASQPDLADVAVILRNEMGQERRTRTSNTTVATHQGAGWGWVYLGKSGRHFKIGRSVSVGRRSYELALQLPERLVMVHQIQTDDPVGIEGYWHRRFDSKRANGEWFALSADDVAAFRRRKFM